MCLLGDEKLWFAYLLEEISEKIWKMQLKKQKIANKKQKKPHFKMPKTPNYRYFRGVGGGGFCSKNKPAYWGSFLSSWWLSFLRAPSGLARIFYHPDTPVWAMFITRNLYQVSALPSYWDRSGIAGLTLLLLGGSTTELLISKVSNLCFLQKILYDESIWEIWVIS